MIHLYIGDGKGKTTAAAGLAVRMAGSGGKVLFIQFLKDGSSGEINILKNFSDIKYRYNSNKFLFAMTPAEKEKVRHDILYMLNETDVTKYNLIVMDEILDCIHENLITEDEISKFLNSKSELVLTGRNASENLKNKADYISEIMCVKHPFEKGISARKGIEY